MTAYILFVKMSEWVFIFFVFLFFVHDFSKACMLIPFAFAVWKRLWSKGNWRKKLFWLFFRWISRERDWKQEDSMTYFRMLIWLMKIKIWGSCHMISILLIVLNDGLCTPSLSLFTKIFTLTSKFSLYLCLIITNKLFVCCLLEMNSVILI